MGVADSKQLDFALGSLPPDGELADVFDLYDSRMDGSVAIRDIPLVGVVVCDPITRSAVGGEQ